MDFAVPRSLSILAGLMLCTPLAAEPVEWPPASQALMHSARLWEARDRGDLAQLALQKLVAARPDSPQALLELGELDLRIRDFTGAAQVIGQLDRRFAGTAAARSFALEYRIATREHVQLASIRRLIEIGRAAEARAALDRLFPDAPPADALGLDYYELLANTPDGGPRATAGLEGLATQHPDDPRYRLALARQLLRGQGHGAAALALLEALMRRDDVLASQVEPLITLAKRRAEDDERALLERQLLAPVAAAELARIQQRVSPELASAGEGAAARAAVEWLERSRASLQAGQTRRAVAELRAALAFHHRAFEAQIELARTLEALGSADEAGELLASASSLEPQSRWLFETDVRWLLAHARAAQAVALLESRAPGGPAAAAAHDALLADALDARAAARQAGGDTAAAIRDLEAAIKLAPRDPWRRFRLATLETSRGASEEGRRIMSEGALLAPDDAQMHYAEALYLENLADYAGALQALDALGPGERSADVSALHDRLRVALARDRARRLMRAGDLAGARAALLEAEPLAAGQLDLAVQLAYAWIEIGSPDHGVALVEPFFRAGGATDIKSLLTWAQILDSAQDDAKLVRALEQLRASTAPGAPERAELARMQRGLDLRFIRALERERRFAEAAKRLDALLIQDPRDRALRAARAELYLATAQPRAARDLYAALAAEQPDDLATRLEYVRALTESGDLRLARAQLAAIEDRVPAGAEQLEINLARRHLALDEPAAALDALRACLAGPHPRPDVLRLAGEAALALREFKEARAYFVRAEQGTGEDAAAARREREAIDARLQASMTAGLIVRHQPGSAAMTQLDLATLASSWLVPLDYEHRLTARLDAVALDAGGSGANAAQSALLGTVDAAGADARPRFANGEQTGVSLAAGYRTDTLSADLGTTPLGFLVSNVVGGLDWTTHLDSLDAALGVARRAVTNSELSFAGLRDPVTGTAWGGVIESGPYARLGLYRPRYSLSGALQFDELTGTHVENNRFIGARLAADLKLVARPDRSLTAGVSLDYWNYQRNLSNFTFGSGGYYSPQSYVSFAVPVELDGVQGGWDYRTRVSPSYALRSTQAAPFYPDDSALESAAAHAPLPAGYATPYFGADRSNALGFYALAAAERSLTQSLVFGAMLEIDRTDYYHPTTLSLYVRHGFGPPRTRTNTPQPLRPYNP